MNPTMRRLLALALASLCTLAGCSGGQSTTRTAPSEPETTLAPSASQNEQAPVTCGDCGTVILPILFDRKDVAPAGQADFQRVVACASDPAMSSVEVAAHTNAKGTEEYNLATSNGIADSIARELEAAGIDASRIEARGYGEGRPLCTQPNADCDARNRRVEITVRCESHGTP